MTKFIAEQTNKQTVMISHRWEIAVLFWEIPNWTGGSTRHPVILLFDPPLICHLPSFVPLPDLLLSWHPFWVCFLPCPPTSHPFFIPPLSSVFLLDSFFRQLLPPMAQYACRKQCGCRVHVAVGASRWVSAQSTLAWALYHDTKACVT